MTDGITGSGLKVAVIGAGNIGGTLAVRWAHAGLSVRIANSRGPASLAGLTSGTSIRPCRLDEVVEGADVVVISVPFGAVPKLRSVLSNESEQLTVLDTGNYVPGLREAPVPAIDAGQVESAWVADILGRRLTKAFNTINAASTRDRALPPGAPNRIAAPVAADCAEDRRIADVLVDTAGFDPIDGGSIADSWRQQPGTPVYTTNLAAAAARAALADARPQQTIDWRVRMAAKA